MADWRPQDGSEERPGSPWTVPGPSGRPAGAVPPPPSAVAPPVQPGQGQSPYGQSPYGQPPYGQPASGQPPQGEPPYAQPPYPQTPYGQPAYGQPAYGQPPYGQPGYSWYPPPPRCGMPAWAWVLVTLGGLAVLAVAALVVFFAVDAATGPDGYGDDPALDALWDECEAGSMAACDDLFVDSPFLSEYEEFGDTCGRRTSGGTDCTDDLGLTVPE